MWPRLLRRFRSSEPLPVRAFDVTTRRWTDICETMPVGRRSLDVSTFNVWFGDRQAERRYTAIADLLQPRQPDVMAFQEVTPASLEVLLAQPWIRRRYRCVSAVREGTSYGMVLLSAVPVGGAARHRIPTRRDRALLRADLLIEGAPLAVGCVHLDSGKSSSPVRARQLRRLSAVLADADDAIALGDFNMRDDENRALPASYADVWPIVRPSDDGFTEDTAVNLMLADAKGKHRQVRFDRVLLRGDAWRPTDIDLLGTKAISHAHPRTFPSDHFGVACRLVRAAS